METKLNRFKTINDIFGYFKYHKKLDNQLIVDFVPDSTIFFHGKHLNPVAIIKIHMEENKFDLYFYIKHLTSIKFKTYNKIDLFTLDECFYQILDYYINPKKYDYLNSAEDMDLI